MRAMRREAEMRREYLLNKAKVLQARATKHKSKVSRKADQSIVFFCTSCTKRSSLRRWSEGGNSVSSFPFSTPLCRFLRTLHAELPTQDVLSFPLPRYKSDTFSRPARTTCL